MLRIPSFFIHFFYLAVIGYVLVAGWFSRSHVIDLQEFSPLNQHSITLVDEINSESLSTIKRIAQNHNWPDDRALYMDMYRMDSLIRETDFSAKNLSPSLMNLQKDSLLHLMKTKMKSDQHRFLIDSLMQDPVNSPWNNSESRLKAKLQARVSEYYFCEDMSYRISYDGGWFDQFDVGLISSARVPLKNNKVELQMVSSQWNPYHIKTGNHTAFVDGGAFSFDTTFYEAGRYPLVVQINSRIMAKNEKVNITDTLWVDVLPR